MPEGGTMRKLLAALVLCALSVALLPAAAGGATLAQRVNKLEAQMDCLKRTPMSMWSGYAWYEADGTVHVVDDPATDAGAVAASFDQAYVGPGAPDYWVVAVKNTSSCRSKFGITTNPYVARALATAGVQRLARVR
jgi:hypothetical protein